MKEAQNHYQKAVNLAQEWSSLFKELQNPYEFSKAIDKGERKLKEALREIELTEKSLRKIKRLNVPDWRKRHADLLLKVSEKEREALEVAKEASQELQKIMGYAVEIEGFIGSWGEASSHFETLSEHLKKERWREAQKEAEEAKKDLESAQSRLKKLLNLNIPGVSEFLKAVDISKKLAEASSRYASAAKEKNYYQANKAASEIKKYSHALEKLNLSQFDFNSFLDSSLKPYLDKIEKLENEAKQLATSADNLYRENTK